MKADFEKAKSYLYKNARPLDMARWRFLFEDGSREDVLHILAAYQNSDGGFGHALEPDCWSPLSSPIQTWVATEILGELRMENSTHPMIRGILRYLGSGQDFDGAVWANSVPANNDYPHATWWQYTPGQKPSYNPTACLAGFIIRHAEPDSPVYALGCRLARESYRYFKAHDLLDEMHTVSCFIRLYDYLTEAGAEDLVDLTEFGDLLCRRIRTAITADKSKWDIEYVCKPSLFIRSKESIFYRQNREIADYECEFIAKTQQPDGTWGITFSWDAYPEEWSVSKNWWKCDLILQNLKYVKQLTASS